MAGSGGILTDLLADRHWRGLPLTDLDATEMVRSLRCAPLLAGYRGSRPADEAAVLDVIHRIAWLAETRARARRARHQPPDRRPVRRRRRRRELHITPAGPAHDWYARHLR